MTPAAATPLAGALPTPSPTPTMPPPLPLPTPPPMPMLPPPQQQPRSFTPATTAAVEAAAATAATTSAADTHDHIEDTDDEIDGGALAPSPGLVLQGNPDDAVAASAAAAGVLDFRVVAPADAAGGARAGGAATQLAVEAGWDVSGAVLRACVQLRTSRRLQAVKIVTELRGFTETRWLPGGRPVGTVESVGGGGGAVARTSRGSRLSSASASLAPTPADGGLGGVPMGKVLRLSRRLLTTSLVLRDGEPLDANESSLTFTSPELSPTPQTLLSQHGYLTIPFAIPLPASGLPPTFSDPSGAIWYALKTTLSFVPTAPHRRPRTASGRLRAPSFASLLPIPPPTSTPPNSPQQQLLTGDGGGSGGGGTVPALLRTHVEIYTPVTIRQPQVYAERLLRLPSQLDKSAAATPTKCGYTVQMSRRVVRPGDVLEVNVAVHGVPAGARLRTVAATLRCAKDFVGPMLDRAARVRLPRPLAEVVESLPLHTSARLHSLSSAAAEQPVFARRLSLLVDPDISLLSVVSPLINVTSTFHLDLVLDTTEVPNVAFEVPIIVVSGLDKAGDASVNADEGAGEVAETLAGTAADASTEAVYGSDSGADAVSFADSAVTPRSPPQLLLPAPATAPATVAAPPSPSGTFLDLVGDARQDTPASPAGTFLDLGPLSSIAATPRSAYGAPPISAAGGAPSPLLLDGGVGGDEDEEERKVTAAATAAAGLRRRTAGDGQGGAAGVPRRTESLRALRTPHGQGATVGAAGEPSAPGHVGASGVTRRGSEL
ncbi:hypothetical protein HK405_008562, partial [Cladochytrium tenue]